MKPKLSSSAFEDPIYDTFYMKAYIHDHIQSSSCSCTLEYKVRRHKTLNEYRVFTQDHPCEPCDKRGRLWRTMQDNTHETLPFPETGVHECIFVLSQLYPDDVNAGMPF